MSLESLWSSREAAEQVDEDEIGRGGFQDLPKARDQGFAFHAASVARSHIERAGTRGGESLTRLPSFELDSRSP